MLEGARSVGIPNFENQNGRMMEGEGGAAIIDIRAHNGKRLSSRGRIRLTGPDPLVPIQIEANMI